MFDTCRLHCNTCQISRAIARGWCTWCTWWHDKRLCGGLSCSFIAWRWRRVRNWTLERRHPTSRCQHSRVRSCSKVLTTRVPTSTHRSYFTSSLITRDFWNVFGQRIHRWWSWSTIHRRTRITCFWVRQQMLWVLPSGWNNDLKMCWRSTTHWRSISRCKFYLRWF